MEEPAADPQGQDGPQEPAAAATEQPAPLPEAADLKAKIAAEQVTGNGELPAAVNGVNGVNGDAPAAAVEEAASSVPDVAAV